MHSLLGNENRALSQVSLEVSDMRGAPPPPPPPLPPFCAGTIEEGFRGDIDRVGISMSFSWPSRFRSHTYRFMVPAK